MIEIFGLKNCDACRKALKALPDAHLRDLRKEGIPDAVLNRAWTEFGNALLNRRSMTWRELSEEARDADPLVLIQSYPTVMKRPLIVAGETITLGWSDHTAAQIRAAI